jgi:hypothetical protein
MLILSRRATALTARLAGTTLVGVVLAGRAAMAQGALRVSGSVDVGAASVAYDDFLRSAVLSAVPAVRVETARTTVVARGAFSQFESGNGALQANLAASALSRELWKLRGEIFGTFGVARYTDTLSAVNLFSLGGCTPPRPSTAPGSVPAAASSRSARCSRSTSSSPRSAAGSG